MVQSAALHDGLTWTDQFAHGLQGAPMRKAGRHDRHISRADQLCERQPPELPHLAREDHLQHLRATSVVHPHDDMCYHGVSVENYELSSLGPLVLSTVVLRPTGEHVYKRM